MTNDSNPTTNLDLLTIALVALTDSGIPTDIQELLVYGSLSRGIPPRALLNVIAAIRANDNGN